MYQLWHLLLLLHCPPLLSLWLIYFPLGKAFEIFWTSYTQHSIIKVIKRKILIVAFESLFFNLCKFPSSNPKESISLERTSSRNCFAYFFFASLKNMNGFRGPLNEQRSQFFSENWRQFGKKSLRFPQRVHSFVVYT